MPAKMCLSSSELYYVEAGAMVTIRESCVCIRLPGYCQLQVISTSTDLVSIATTC